MMVNKKNLQRTSIISISSAVIIFTLGIFSFNIKSMLNELFMVSILVAIIPITVIDFIRQRWLNAIKDQMPYFVRGISESQNIGVTIIESLEYVIKNELIKDPLFSEIEEILARVSWGQSFEDSITEFMNKIDLPMVNRFSVLLLEVYRTGGNIQEAFLIQSEFIDDIREMDNEASSQMLPYIAIIYVAFFVFLITSIILLNSFFMPLEELSTTISMGLVISLSEIKNFFYQTMLVSGLMSGIMTGKISELRVVSGFKHSIILIVLGYFVFFVSVPPVWFGGV